MHVSIVKFTLCLVQCNVPVAMDLLSTSADHGGHQVGCSVCPHRVHTAGSPLCTPIAKCMGGEGEEEGEEEEEEEKEGGEKVVEDVKKGMR